MQFITHFCTFFYRAILLCCSHSDIYRMYLKKDKTILNRWKKFSMIFLSFASILLFWSLLSDWANNLSVFKRRKPIYSWKCVGDFSYPQNVPIVLLTCKIVHTNKQLKVSAIAQDVALWPINLLKLYLSQLLWFDTLADATKMFLQKMNGKVFQLPYFKCRFS